MLKAYILDIRKRISTYIPVKSDALDVALGEFINKHPNRDLRLTFLRVKEGVYDFGSRQLMLVLNRGMIQIKEGTGFKPID